MHDADNTLPAAAQAAFLICSAQSSVDNPRLTQLLCALYKVHVLCIHAAREAATRVLERCEKDSYCS